MENRFRQKDMLKVTAVEFLRHFGRYQDLAQRQPVAVTRNGRNSTVLLSSEEYLRLKRRDRQVLDLAEFTDADIRALENARPSPESVAFDSELPR